MGLGFGLVSRFLTLAAVFVVLAKSCAFATATMELNTRAYNCGIAVEGKTKKIEAIFLVKNTGDEVLRLSEVRPTCGCTVVRFDSLVPPGKTTKIRAEVNIEGHRSGPISKGIKVLSNAENEPALRLSIDATIESIVHVADQFIGLNSTNRSVPRIVRVTSKESGLRITGVTFRSVDNGQGAGWQSRPPLTIRSKWNRTDSVNVEGQSVFLLELYSPSAEKPVSGQFLFRTNQPYKREVCVLGGIRN
jgi:hypothetical protein